jgi:hypothetical protein
MATRHRLNFVYTISVVSDKVTIIGSVFATSHGEFVRFAAVRHHESSARVARRQLNHQNSKHTIRLFGIAMLHKVVTSLLQEKFVELRVDTLRSHTKCSGCIRN